MTTSCSLCVALGLGGLASAISSCSTSSFYTTEAHDNMLTVPLSIFAETDLQIVRPGNIGYDIALHRQPDGKYDALVLRCTHADNPLSYTGSAFSCDVHGSKFDKEGIVLRGPAARPLKKLPVRMEGDHIIIQVV